MESINKTVISKFGRNFETTRNLIFKKYQTEQNIRHLQNQNSKEILKFLSHKNSNPNSIGNQGIDSDEGNRSILPDDFIAYKMIGKGSFGEVYLVRYLKDQKLYALKVLNKNQIFSQNLVKYVFTERNVMKSLKHPYIVSLNSAFQTNSQLFLVLEYCPGSDLGSKLRKEKKCA